MQALIATLLQRVQRQIDQLAPGITQGPNGGTHMDFTDLSIMRTMPNMHVYAPADVYELRSVMQYMAANKQPTYMQLIRSKQPKIFDESYKFDPDKAVVLKDGGDVTLVTTGYMVPFAVKAADELAAKGIQASVLHYPSVKPFDAATLIASARKTGAVVTIENQTILGGLGSSVCEVLSENCPVRVKRLGIPDKFGEVSTEKYMFEKHGFGISHIVAAAAALAKK